MRRISAIITKFWDAQNKLRSRSPIRYSIRKTRVVGKFFWCPERLISAIGMESFSSERVVQTTSGRCSARPIDTKARNRTTSVESGFGRGHPVPKPIEPVDFAPHAESIGVGAPFVDQLGGAFAVVGCIAVQ
jgi:hypothetical protein